MDMADAVCPACGTINRNLFLRETDGWFECEYCMTISKVNVHDLQEKEHAGIAPIARPVCVTV